MILVNNPGSWDHVYPPLEHAEWNGWTATDLIFPFFLFIVGVSLVLSLTRRQGAGIDRAALVRKIVGRAAAIVAIGFMLNLIPRFDLATVRIPGVLQRIGVVYLITALLVVFTAERTQRIVLATLLLGYWLLMTRVPVPGHGVGALAPDANLAQWLDLRIFARHMWKPRWDPEGILSTIPAVGTCLMGTLAGRWLQLARSPTETAAALLVWGNSALVSGLVADHWFPINKSLWTSSYVLVTGGAALMLFGVLYWIIDVRQRRDWAWPLYVFGANALAVFVLSGLLARALLRVHVGGGSVSLQAWIYQRAFASWAGPSGGSLAFAAAYLLFWLGVMAIFYRRRWFIRL